MIKPNGKILAQIMRISSDMLPFADVASRDLPLSRLLRLSLFQVSVGMTMVLLAGTLNRVMIVELGVSAGLVAIMIALPVVIAPLRALIGFRSDTHRSYLGWRRVPYIWFGSLLQFGGLAIMPFALLLLSSQTDAPPIAGLIGAGLAFVLAGAGIHTTQTAGLALATDLASRETQPRVVALLYVMLLVGMTVSALLIGALLAEFSELRLVQVIQGTAVVAIVLNLVALWKQEARNTVLTAHDAPRPSFSASWQQFRTAGPSARLLTAVALGAAAFAMQDILLEPYGGEVLGMGVGATTALTALMAGGSLVAFALAARMLSGGGDAYRLAANGALVGICGFAIVIFAGPLQSANVFCAGVAAIGFGSGLFAVGTLTASMTLAKTVDQTGLVLGAWGGVQATAAGAAMALGGMIRDGVSGLAASGSLGTALNDPSVGYGFVYHIEIALLFATLVAIGPLVRRAGSKDAARPKIGLVELPG